MEGVSGSVASMSKRGDGVHWPDRIAAGAFGAAMGMLALSVFHDPIVPLTTVVVAVITHRFVHAFLRACAIATAASIVLSVIHVTVTGQVNDMIGVFVILGGAYAFLLSMAVGFPFVLNRHPGFLGRLWRGETPLAQAYWSYGFVLNGVFASVALVIGSDVPAYVGFVWWPFYLAYFAVVLVAVWRSSERYPGPRLWAMLARVAVLVDVIRLVLQLASVIVPPVAAVLRERRPLTDRFDLNSTGSTYPFVTRLQGSLTERGDSLLIEVDTGFVGSRLPVAHGAAGNGLEVSIAFGLGLQHGTYGWDFGLDSLTSPQVVARVLRPGETARVGRLRIWIRGIENIPLADRWLAAEVRVRSRLPAVRLDSLISYACAEENLRGPTPASRLRAKGMKTQYSRAC